jgi:hypothetical protein
MAKHPLANFDYALPCDDFLLYELARLIDEDRASLEDDEFRRVIEAGIHEHIERRLDIRAAMALRLRRSSERPGRLLHAIEDIEAPLGDILPVIQSYTAYLFERLEACSEADPDERITAAADMLLESPDDRDTAEPALDVLGTIQSAVSARVLAHAISEPQLPEDLEARAYEYLKRMWPLPRHYILYSLRPHTHEDIPFRWFQLLVDSREPSAVDRIIEEVVVHAGNEEYVEDLLSLLQLFEQTPDPEAQDKILQVVNDPHTPKPATQMLQEFLKSGRPVGTGRPDRGKPWDLEGVYAMNRRYVAAARLLDEGRKAEAARAIEDLLKEDPQYPFAVMLKQLL